MAWTRVLCGAAGRSTRCMNIFCGELFACLVRLITYLGLGLAFQPDSLRRFHSCCRVALVVFCLNFPCAFGIIALHTAPSQQRGKHMDTGCW